MAVGLAAGVCHGRAQQADVPPAPARTQRFLAQRTAGEGTSPAQALQLAHAQQAAMLAQPRTASLTAGWQPLGPSSIVSAAYGNLSGRITALALDPNDATGNTLYVGTTGGGVWKSTNATRTPTAATFAPLTDTLPVFAAGSVAIASLSMGALAVQPSVNPVLLAGTGDPNDATDSYYGEGLLRSTDNGLTWTLIQESHDGVNGVHSFVGLATAALAFSSATPTLAVAAFSTSVGAALESATNPYSVPGLYYSTDAGVTWQMSTLYDGTTIVQQPQPVGTGGAGNAVTSVVYDALRGQFFAAVQSHGYYASSDGITWTRMSAQPGTKLTAANCPPGVGGTGAATCPIFRGTLAVQAATGDLYALTVDANNLDQGLWQDLCNASSGRCSNASPTFATRIDNGALEGSGNTIMQGSYNLALAAAPASNNGTLLFAGTVDLYRCAIAANSTTCALRNTTNALNGCGTTAAVAPAQHALANMAQSNAPPLLFLGNDGGLWRSLDGVAETGTACSASDASHFTNLNAAIGAGGSLAEITGFAQHPADANTLLAGLGEIGSAATTSASSLAAWPQLSVGEGGLPSLDANTPNNWYLAIGAGVDLKQCPLGAGCTAASFALPATIGEAQVSSDATVLDAPTLLDPALTTNVIIGTCRVWRGPAGSSSTWNTSNALGPAFNRSATPCTAASPLIRSLAAGGPLYTSTSSQYSGSTVIYAGLAGSLDGGSTLSGHLLMTKSANTASAATPWIDTALPNAAGFDVSSIFVDTHDATGATVYATLMGFNAPHLYGSTNFGATWTNLSANLPNAPANAVVVDPNDANTVYLALDAGVYVTTDITSCPSSNCWSLFGTSLPNTPVIALAAAPNMPTSDGRLGMIRAATYGRGLWQQPLLTAISPAQPVLTLSATSFTFASQQVATQSSAQALTITNTGNAPATISSLVLSGDFAETDNCTDQALAVNASCPVNLRFAPTATGTRTGQLTIYANVSGGQANVSLTGVGTAPASIVLTPLSLTFAATVINQTTAAQTITIANTGGAAATLQTPVATGDFSMAANTCTSTLAPSTACSVSLTFTPTASGTRTGTLTITDSAGTQTAQLAGIGNAPATDTLSTTALTFAQQQIGTSSAVQLVTLTNAGDVPLTLIQASISAGDFTVVNNCGASLVGHASCALSVSFVPTATGTRSATLTISDQFRSQIVALAGTGVAPPGVSLSPTSLSFAATGVGLAASAQTLTLTNNGGLPLAISNIAVGAAFTIAATTCANTLAVGAACALQIVFAPIAAGPVAAAVTLTDNAPSGTQTALLTGTGVDFTLTPSGPTTVALSSGTSAMYPLLLSSLSTLSGAVAISCSGAPSHSTCTASPNTPSLGGTTSIVVTVATGVARLDAPVLPHHPHDEIYLALILPVALLALRRRRILSALVALTVVCALTSCSSGRLIPTDSSPVSTPTPTGTYSLVVSASSTGITHTVSLTLTVQ